MKLKGIVRARLFGFDDTLRDILIGADGRVAEITPHYGARLTGQRGVIDLNGGLLLPGFIDSHTHLIGAGLYETIPSLVGVTTTEEIASLVEDEDQSGRELIRLGRIDLSKFSERDGLNLGFLDSLETAKPVIISMIEGHSALINTKAFETFFREERVQGIDLTNGEFTGFVFGRARELLADRLHRLVILDEKLRALKAMQQIAFSRGVTTIHCLEGYHPDKYREDFQLIMEFTEREPIDLVLYPQCEDIALLRELGIPRLGGCILLDGAIGAHTAALREPYLDRKDTKGILYKTDGELRGLVRNAFTAGMQTTFHAIGDRAIRQIGHIYRELSTKFDLRELRPRIEHFCLPADQEIRICAELGVSLGMQPSFIHHWGLPGGKYEQYLGGKRWASMHPFRKATDRGIVIGGGSDAPVTPIEPLAGIQSLLLHPVESQRLNFTEAIKVFTENNAFLSKEEKSKGRIEKGFDADFVAFGKDLDCLQPEEILEVKPLLTIKRGELVYDARSMK